MSRLLMLLLLYKNGYSVGKYISIEKQIEKTKDRYYDTLQEADAGWHEEKMIRRLLSDTCCRQCWLAIRNLRRESV